MYLSVGTWEEPPIAVRNIDFSAQGTGRGINGLGGSCNFTGEALSWKCWQFNRSGQTTTNCWRINFRNGNVDANWIKLRDHKKFLVRTTITGIDQCADIRVTPRNCPRKRGVYMFE